MRWSSLAAVVVATGCVHSPANPQSVTASVDASPAACTLIETSHSILLKVRNAGPGKLRIKAQSESGPPFRMGWPYYAILSAETDPPAVYQSPVGHGNLPIANVSVGPEDETQFLLYLGERTPVSRTLRYRVQFEDQEGQLHFSPPFSLCVPGSMPNNSLKPTPLRGAA